MLTGRRARLYPLGALVRRLAGGKQRALADAADAVEILAEEETVARAPVIMLPEAPDKARAVTPGFGSLRAELDMLRTPRVRHAAVIRYTFGDCLVRPGGVEARRMRFRVGERMGFAPVRGKLTPVETGHYCMTPVSRAYFGHWLQDACATALLAAGGETVFLDRLEDTAHGPAYLAAFGLAPEPSPVSHVQRLHLYQDFGQGPHKRARYAEMRARLEAAFPGREDGGDRLYLRRGTSGQARAIADEEALIARLAREGFETLDIMQADLATIQRRCRRARLVVSIEGSHLSHLQLAMPAGSCMIALMPADRVSALQAGYAQAAGLRFGLVMAEPGPDGYRVDTGDLLATLEMAERPG